MLKLILVRHGETEWNLQKRVQGLSDMELNEKGQQQARSISGYLEGEKIEAIYSSPLKRALATAQIIARFHGLPVNVEPGLQELDHGDLDGLTTEEMRARYPNILKQWAKGATTLKLPGGESLQELQERAWGATLKILDRHPGGNVVMVSHNLALLSIICKAMGLHLPLFRRLRLDLGSISVLEGGEQGFLLVKLNHTCHL